SKMMIIDDEVASVGSSNMDIRSFELNFEINAFMYDANIVKELKAAFIEDMKVSKELTEERYEQRSNWIKFKQSIAKLAIDCLNLIEFDRCSKCSSVNSFDIFI